MSRVVGIDLGTTNSLVACVKDGKPVVIRVDSDAGHGIGSTRDQGFAEKADVWGFMLTQMGER